MKTSYISPSTGDLEITVIRDANPSVTIELDLGIPNFTRFSLKFPLVVDEPKNMATVTQEALGVLLDEVATFMMSLSFDQAVITDIYARALSCFAGLDMSSSTQAEFPASAQDHQVQTFEGKFALPMSFVEETHNRVVTGAQVIKRLPAVRKIEFAPTVPSNKIDTRDAQRVIKMYRNRQLKTQPKPLFIIVYDQMGNATGVLPVQQQWKSKLLQRIQAKTANWTDAGRNVYVTDASDFNIIPNHAKLCPACGKPIPGNLFKAAPRNAEGEIESWSGKHGCGATLTIFND